MAALAFCLVLSSEKPDSRSAATKPSSAVGSSLVVSVTTVAPLPSEFSDLDTRPFFSEIFSFTLLQSTMRLIERFSLL